MSKWTCPECGGTWDAIELNEVGKKIFDIFDSVKICSRCCQLKLAETRIAELGSAAQWHPASEPPEDDNFIALLLVDDKGNYSWEKARYTKCLIDGVPTFGYRFADCNVSVAHTRFNAIGWCNVPEVEV